MFSIGWKLVLSGAVASAAVGSHGAELKGTVLLPDGKPSAFARVWLFPKIGSPACTGADSHGVFKFAKAPASGDLVAMPSEGSVAWQRISFLDAGAVIELQALPATSIKGTLRDDQGKPVAGAKVYAASISREPRWRLTYVPQMELNYGADLPFLSTRTDADGRFELTRIPDDATVWVGALADGLVSPANSMGLPSWWPTTEEVQYATWRPGAPPLDVWMVRPPVMKGKLPSKGTISFEPLFAGELKNTIATDDAGRFAIPVNPATYHVVGRLSNGAGSDERGVAATDGVVDVPLKPAEKAAVSGVLPQDGWGPSDWMVRGDPLSGGHYHGAYRYGDIDSQGRFVLRLGPGRWKLEARSPATYCYGSVEIKGLQPREVKLTAKKLVPMVLHVVDSAGHPAAGAYVSAALTVRTDSRGMARIRSDLGRHSIVAASADLTEFGSAEPYAGEPHRMVRLRAGSEVTGQVVDNLGKPMEGAVCEVGLPLEQMKDEYQPAYRVRTDAAGRFRVHVPFGEKIRLVVRKAGYGPAQRDDVRTGAQEVQTTFSLQPSDRIAQGVVHDLSGAPAPKVFVIARWHDAGILHQVRYAAAATDEHGRFRIEGLPRGTYVEVRVMWTTRYEPVAPDPNPGDLSKIELLVQPRRARS